MVYLYRNNDTHCKLMTMASLQLQEFVREEQKVKFCKNENLKTVCKIQKKTAEKKQRKTEEQPIQEAENI